MTFVQKAHANLAKAIQLYDAGQRPIEIVRKYYSIYANGTYGLDNCSLLAAARVCVECRPRSTRTK